MSHDNHTHRFIFKCHVTNLWFQGVMFDDIIIQGVAKSTSLSTNQNLAVKPVDWSKFEYIHESMQTYQT